MFESILTLQIKGKLNAITLDQCTKCGLVFESVVAACEVVNSRSVQVCTGVPHDHNSCLNHSTASVTVPTTAAGTNSGRASFGVLGCAIARKCLTAHTTHCCRCSAPAWCRRSPSTRSTAARSAAMQRSNPCNCLLQLHAPAARALQGESPALQLVTSPSVTGVFG